MNAMISGYFLTLAGDLALLAFGVLIHFFMTLEQMSATKQARVLPMQFLRERPYKSILMIAGALVGYILIRREVPNPSPELLIAIGYAGNDAIDKLTSVAATRYKNGNGRSEPPV